jgi:hypothetical protein
MPTRKTFAIIKGILEALLTAHPTRVGRILWILIDILKPILAWPIQTRSRTSHGSTTVSVPRILGRTHREEKEKLK